MLSYAATLLVGFVLAALWAGTPQVALAVLAMLGFLTRDICIFLLGRFLAGPKGDFAALAILAALYLILPTVFWRANLGFLLLPATQNAGALPVVAAWIQAVALIWWVIRSIRYREDPR
jgi:hypothetical protein